MVRIKTEVALFVHHARLISRFEVYRTKVTEMTEQQDASSCG